MDEKTHADCANAVSTIIAATAEGNSRCAARGNFLLQIPVICSGLQQNRCASRPGFAAVERDSSVSRGMRRAPRPFAVDSCFLQLTTANGSSTRACFEARSARTSA